MENEPEQNQTNEEETTNEEDVLETAEETTKLLEEKKMSLKKKIGIGIVVIFFIIAVAQVLTASKYEAVVQVIEEEGKIGVNPLTERLDFGDLSRGSSAIRYVTLKSKGESPVLIEVVKFGSIADLIQVSKNNFTLEPGEEVKLEFFLKMPPSADQEKYNGWVWIFRIPKLF